MTVKRAERRRRVEVIRRQAKSTNGGRSYHLPGLLASRLAASMTQREVAEKIGSNLATVRNLELKRRGAYVATIRRLCEALGVTPEVLLCEDADKREEARR